MKAPLAEICTTSLLQLLASTIFIHFLAMQLDAYSIPVTPAVHNHSEADRHALLCLKSQIHDPSEALVSWRDNSFAFCEWHGVTCGKRHVSRVIALDLESENITGEIFPCVADLSFLARIHMPGNHIIGNIGQEIGQLTQLRYINLSMNSIRGEIPLTISSCHRLKTIDLYSNSIQGEIPSTLAQCSSLQSVILSNNNLQGFIPQQIGLLPNLSALFLPNNQLTGSIPQKLGSSKFLRWVYLQNNSISGGIPAALFNSTSLSYLDLSRNNLSGPIPPFSQTSFSPLEYLSLTENILSGEIPHSIGNLSTLSSLILGNNNLYGTIPESLSKLGSLQVLHLNNNNLSGHVPPTLYNISSLTYLGCAFNHLVGRLPTNVGDTLPNINELILAVNQFDGPIPASLVNATNLQALDLHSNAFTDVIPPLGSLTMLSFLDLGMNILEAGDWTFLSSLTSCRQLRNLWLDKNKLQGIIPSYIANISQSLEYLVLAENQLTSSIPLEMGNFTNLTVLLVNKNLLSGNIPDTLGNLQNLAILGLSQNKLSGEIPKSIGKLERLTELYFQENDLTGHIPASLAGCRRLLILNLSCNGLVGSIPRELFSISTLSLALDLSYNKISGEIPSEIGGLISLNSLNVSNNQLSGEIPSTLGQCLLLDSLNMEVNLLHGSIPDTFINLRGITEMDLSLNNLSGIIPKFFETFSSLKILNLSFNDLEGPLPLGGILVNSSNLLFIQGNIKLCATSPIQQLPLCVTSPPKSKKTTDTVAVLVPLSILLAVTLASAAIIILKRRKIKEPKNPSLEKFKNLSYADLFKATDGFSPNYLVGSGRFGLVYKGQFNSGIGSVAIKVFKLDQLGAPSNFLSECEALRNIRHRNLIKVISLCSTFDPTGNEFKALILEYMGNGNLECWLHPKDYGQSTSNLSLGSRIGIAVDIAAALDYLHCRCTPPLVHRDLKPSNILLDDEMIARLSDFGLAKFLLTDSSMEFKDSTGIAGPKGSVGYIAPEYGMGCKASIYGDIYSYGIILLEMITGKCPTDEMFKDGLNLRTFVESSLSQKTVDILEPDITRIHEAVNGSQIMDGILSCALHIANLGLNCSEISPKDRPTTEEAYAEILSIKEEFSTMCNWESWR